MGAGGTWAARRDISSTQKQRREEVLQQKQQRQLLVCRLRVWVPNKALLGSVGTAIANSPSARGVLTRKPHRETPAGRAVSG